MKLELPWPPACLSPNRKNGGHWGKTNAAKVKHKNDCYFLAITKRRIPEGNIPMTLIFHPPTKHRRDLDNCLSSCKAMLDGVAQAWGIDDSRFHPITIDWGDVVKHGKVVIEV